MNEINCEICLRLFIPASHNAKFCSAECRIESRRKWRREWEKKRYQADVKLRKAKIARGIKYQKTRYHEDPEFKKERLSKIKKYRARVQGFTGQVT